MISHDNKTYCGGGGGGGSVGRARPPLAHCSASQDSIHSFSGSSGGAVQLRSSQAHQSIPSSHPPCIHCLSSPCSPDQSPPPAVAIQSPSVSPPVGFELTGLDPLRGGGVGPSSSSSSAAGPPTPPPHCSGHCVPPPVTHHTRSQPTVYRLAPNDAAHSPTDPRPSCPPQRRSSTASATRLCGTEFLSPPGDDGAPVLPATAPSTARRVRATSKCLQTGCASTYSPLPGSNGADLSNAAAAAAGALPRLRLPRLLLRLCGRALPPN
eukprot:GHVS01037736.1.p1 GENE.GHVS01037736.1~~GHVS01037736.1.p1  ORF type:complete len:266 (-),score=62.98 GHVS01037736.1:21-818(-)